MRSSTINALVRTRHCLTDVVKTLYARPEVRSKLDEIFDFLQSEWMPTC